MNFSDKCCGKFSMSLTLFFCKSNCKDVFLHFSRKESSSRTLAVASNKTKRYFVELQQDFNFSDKCCGKFSMSLTLFFCKSNCKDVFLHFSRKESSSRTLAVASNKTKRYFVELQQDFTTYRVFFHSANSLTSHCVRE